jgi:hypothetical protein
VGSGGRGCSGQRIGSKVVLGMESAQKILVFLAIIRWWGVDEDFMRKSPVPLEDEVFFI